MALAIAALIGCSDEGPGLSAGADARATCGGKDCHDAAIDAHVRGKHASVTCESCHEGATEHAEDPPSVAVRIDWTIDGCAECHSAIATTYLYDDNVKMGPFGGSQREPAIAKVETFPELNTILAGHGFTRDYSEEGAHRWMYQEHYETLRGKYETCVQCKSTKVAWAWDTGKQLAVEEDTAIVLTHTATDATPAREVVVPAGTTVEFGTDPRNSEVLATARYAGGRTYTSRPGPMDDAAEHQNMLWAATIAATKETMPYGAGCNHCHDPHSTELRVIRKAMLQAIEEQTVNPYDPNAAASFDDANARDKEVLTCAQCHVEYTCGRSGIDGMDRDRFGWTKAANLHEEYMERFGYKQDWAHALIDAPLIKSQHPETELFWDSPHYNAGASCASCHMPSVQTASGEWVRSHWFTSPYKYGDAETYSAFAQATGMRASALKRSNPCTLCHDDRTTAAIEGQRRVFERQQTVQQLLAQSIAEIERLKSAAGSGVSIKHSRLDQAVEAHQRAHVLWENLIVSENSMGFHNFAEVMSAMDQAELEARAALDFADKAWPDS